MWKRWCKKEMKEGRINIINFEYFYIYFGGSEP